MVIAVVDVVLSAIAVWQAFKALQATLKVAGKKALRTSAQNEVTGETLPNSQGATCNQGKCFIAGTKVKTEDGYKNIEEVEVGDKVLAYDEETGKQAYKEVVRLFRGKTDEWYHVFAEGEEIVCTGGHRFYVEGKGFVEAKDLTEEDKLTLSDGSQVKIEKIEKEELAKAETKYNFEVKDFHTYYVTENDVLVHNDCKIQTGGAKEYSIHESRNAAYRAAKRHAGIPMSEQPIKVVQSVDRLGKVIPGRTYIFKNGTQIMEHSAGHIFENGINMTRHFNILGSRMHFFY